MMDILLPTPEELHHIQLRDEAPERILCAAIHNPDEKDLAGNPLIHCGHRHHNILHQSKAISRKMSHQGFLTSKGRFVNREEAYQIALKNNQIIGVFLVVGEQLYSECLY
ncbi:MAG: hypothetical protein M9949_04985 [Candidatus Kapabacteria bacterium]|nr:hypothetical protein [Candidatus Kapabacteria bacterium]